MELFELNHIGVCFGKNRALVSALSDITVKIREKETLAIVGPSGAGKSTLLNVLSGLEKPTEGTITYDGKNYSALKDKELSEIRLKEFGFVFQAFYLMSSLNVFDNIVLPVAADKREYDKAFLEELIEELQLGERLTHLPSELSGGEKQRVAIARALINRPRVLFADEPSGNLDSKTGIVVFDLLFRLSKKYNMTLVYVTHDINKAEMADRMIVMEDGKIK